MSNEREPIRQPERLDPLGIEPSEQLTRLREATDGLFAFVAWERPDLDAPVHPLAHMDTAKQLAEVAIRASLLIEHLGLDPAFMLTLKLAELLQRHEGMADGGHNP